MMNNNNNVSFYPARYSLNYSNVVAVGSTNPDDSRTAPFFWSATSGSNYGTHINVVAPGNYIYGLSHTSNTDSTSFWGGTSQATPLVAGIASLLFAQNPSLTPSQVRTILQNTAVDEVGNSSEDTPGFDQYMGYGRVNAFEALQLATLNTAEIDSTIGQEFVLLNPIKNDELLLNCKGNYEGDYQLKLYAMDGKLLFSRTTKIIRGDTIIPFNFPSGNYIFSLQSDLYTKNFKVNKL